MNTSQTVFLTRLDLFDDVMCAPLLLRFCIDLRAIPYSLEWSRLLSGFDRGYDLPRTTSTASAAAQPKMPPK